MNRDLGAVRPCRLSSNWFQRSDVRYWPAQLHAAGVSQASDTWIQEVGSSAPSPHTGLLPSWLLSAAPLSAPNSSRKAPPGPDRFVPRLATGGIAFSQHLFSLQAMLIDLLELRSHAQVCHRCHADGHGHGSLPACRGWTKTPQWIVHPDQLAWEKSHPQKEQDARRQSASKGPF